MGGSQFQLVEKRRRVPDLGAVDMQIRPLLERMCGLIRHCARPWGRSPAGRPTGSAQDAGRAVIWLRSATAARKRGAGVAGRIVERAERAQPLAGGGRGGIVAAGRRWWICLLQAGLVERPGTAVLPPPPKLAGTMVPPKVEPAGPPPGRQETEKLSAQPTATPSPALDGPGRAERIRKYVAQYSGGDCFLSCRLL